MSTSQWGWSNLVSRLRLQTLDGGHCLTLDLKRGVELFRGRNFDLVVSGARQKISELGLDALGLLLNSRASCPDISGCL